MVMTYIDIIAALPDLLLNEKHAIRDILIEQIGLPIPPGRRKELTLAQAAKKRRKLLIAAIKRLQRGES
jgi:hypothetical protein